MPSFINAIKAMFMTVRDIIRKGFGFLHHTDVRMLDGFIQDWINKCTNVCMSEMKPLIKH